MDYRMPLYIQMQDIILKKIEDKKFLPGEAIPSERKLAELYGVNRMTVKKAIDKLVEEGYLIRKAGSGTYVAKIDNKKIDLNYANESGNTGVSAQFKQVGVQVKNVVLGKGLVEDSLFLDYKLGLEKGEKVWGLYRLRMADDKNFAVEYTYVPQKYFDNFEEFDFSKISLYDYMDAKGKMPQHFSQRLIICEANEKVADILKVKKGTTVFKIEYQGADEDYNIVEYTISYLNPEYAEFKFIAENKPDQE